MTMYCVATLARYVLVEATDETAAREAGIKRFENSSLRKVGWPQS